MNNGSRWIVGGLFLLTLGCGSSIPELWPPEQGVPSHTILVSLDTWHSAIVFPHQTQAGNSSHPPLFEQWGYAEQAWYLKGQQGISGVFRALLWVSPGVVEVGHHGQIWRARSTQRPTELFIFEVTQQGYLRLRNYLESTVASHQPISTAGGSKFYRSTPSYNLFHHCHHYTAKALREAGLPIASIWALTPGMFATQLRRAERIASEPGYESTSAEQ